MFQDTLETLCVRFIFRHWNKVDRINYLPFTLKERLIECLAQRNFLLPVHLEQLLDSTQTSLNFDTCTSLNDAALKLVSRRCPRLSRLSLTRCHGVTPRGLQEVMAGCPLTTHLNLDGTSNLITPKTVRYFEKNCRGLLSLSLAECQVKERPLCQLLAASCGFVKHLNLSACRGVTDLVLHTVAEHCSQLQSLELADLDRITPTAVARLVAACPHLGSLNLAQSAFTAPELCTIIDASVNLRSLDLSFPRPGNAFSDAVLASIARNCTNLVSLTVVGAFAWRGEALVQLLSRCTQLERLVLDVCKDVGDFRDLRWHRLLPELSTTTHSSPRSAATSTHSASSHIASTNAVHPTSAVTSSASVGAASGRAPTSEATPTSNTTPTSEDTVLRRGPYALKHLSLCGLRNLMPRSLELVGKLFPNLEVLNIAGLRRVDDDVVIPLLKRCTKLRKLDLSMLRKLTDHTLVQVAKTCGPRLEVLKLFGNAKLSDEGVSALAEHCPNLRLLSLYGNSKLTDRSVVRVAQCCTRLASFDCSGLSNITDKSMIALAGSTTHLHTLQIRACHKVTDAGMSALLRGCSQLRRLSANDCTSLTDHFLRSVAKCSQQLEILSITDNPNFSDAGFLVAGRACHLLKQLRMSSRSRVSRTAIETMQRDRPHLRVVFC